MDINAIQREVDKVRGSSFAHKTDPQLWSYQELSDRYYLNLEKLQPKVLVKYNKPANRACKLTQQQVNEIRDRYIPHVFGKKRLALEYGVSPSVILRILKGKSWKVYDDPD
jgi:hypothetical protein